MTILMTIFDDKFWWQFLMTLFDDNFGWQFLWQFLMTILTILTTFDKFGNFWQFYNFTILQLLTVAGSRKWRLNLFLSEIKGANPGWKSVLLDQSLLHLDDNDDGQDPLLLSPPHLLQPHIRPLWAIGHSRTTEPCPAEVTDAGTNDWCFVPSNFMLQKSLKIHTKSAT